MPAFKLHSFKVRGTGSFPTDMLRYDQCWPSGQADVNLIDMSIDDTAYFKARTVTLDSINPPTVGRWESFMWRVVS